MIEIENKKLGIIEYIWYVVKVRGKIVVDI